MRKGKDKMRVVADIVEQDYWIYNKYAMWNLPKMRKAFIVNFLGAHLTILMMMILLKEPPRTILLATIFLGLVADVLIVIMFRSKVKKTANTQRGILGRHVMEISEAGISDRTAEHHTFMTWSDITDIVQDIHNIYIFRGMSFAHIVPIRSFSGEEEKNAFFAEAIKLWRK